MWCHKENWKFSLRWSHLILFRIQFEFIGRKKRISLSLSHTHFLSLSISFLLNLWLSLSFSLSLPLYPFPFLFPSSLSFTVSLSRCLSLFLPRSALIHCQFEFKGDPMAALLLKYVKMHIEKLGSFFHSVFFCLRIFNRFLIQQQQFFPKWGKKDLWYQTLKNFQSNLTFPLNVEWMNRKKGIAWKSPILLICSIPQRSGYCLPHEELNTDYTEW